MNEKSLLTLIREVVFCTEKRLQIILNIPVIQDLKTYKKEQE